MANLTILCPTDFSVASRGALRYALLIAEREGADVTLLTVTDPVMNEAAELKMGAGWLTAQSERELRRFFEQVTESHPTTVKVSFEVASGKSASAILERARQLEAGLIVMSSRGNSGVRKLFFGATTERVLRETEFPVLVTPAHDPGPIDFEGLRRRVRHVLVPLDFMGASGLQMQAAHAIATHLEAGLIVAHVIEPVWFATAAQPHLPHLDRERRDQAQRFLTDATHPVETTRPIEALSVFGDPAEEIAKIATDRQVGLIVMGLHASPRNGPRMGSVTYRVLCLAQTPVLAMPPSLVQRAATGAAADTSAAAH